MTPHLRAAALVLVCAGCSPLPAALDGGTGDGGGDSGTAVSDGGATDAGPDVGTTGPCTIIVVACLPSDPTCLMPRTTVGLSEADAGPDGGTYVIVSAEQSHYPLPDGGEGRPLSRYGYRLVSSPGNATGHALEKDGLNDAGASTKLVLDPSALGLYRVIVSGWDGNGKQCNLSGLLQLNVTQ